MKRYFLSSQSHVLRGIRDPRAPLAVIRHVVSSIANGGKIVNPEEGFRTFVQIRHETPTKIENLPRGKETPVGDLQD
jgi:hypothetical protein